MTGLRGFRALVTGGASGIGLAEAQLMRDRGAEVAVLDNAAVGPVTFSYVRGDLTDDAAVRDAVGRVVESFGGLDILVTNAAIGARGTVESNDDPEWQCVFDVNVFGLVRVTRAALPTLRRSVYPSIVNTCSVAATLGLPERALYSASKGAVLSLTQAMAADSSRKGCR